MCMSSRDRCSTLRSRSRPGPVLAKLGPVTSSRTVLYLSRILQSGRGSARTGRPRAGLVRGQREPTRTEPKNSLAKIVGVAEPPLRSCAQKRATPAFPFPALVHAADEGSPLHARISPADEVAKPAVPFPEPPSRRAAATEDDRRTTPRPSAFDPDFALTVRERPLFSTVFEDRRSAARIHRGRSKRRADPPLCIRRRPAITVT